MPGTFRRTIDKTLEEITSKLVLLDNIPGINKGNAN